MPNRKLKLAYMENNSLRKRTYEKRKNGIMKKMEEISVLCGVDACAVISSPLSPDPVVWPSIPGAKNVVERFQMLPEEEKVNKMVDHEAFVKQIIDKTKEYNENIIRDNKEKTMKGVMFQYLRGNGHMLGLSNSDRHDLINYINNYLKKLYIHKESFQNQSPLQHGESSSAPYVMAPIVITEGGSSSVGPRAIPEVGSSSLGPRGVTASSAANFMAPRAIIEGGSSSLGPRGITASFLAPRAITEMGSSSLGPRTLVGVGSSSVTPRTITEVGSSSMAPRAIPEGSSFSIPNSGVFNSPLLTSDLWDMKPLEHVNNYANNFQGYNSMMNQVGVYDQHSNISNTQNQDQYQQQSGYPVTGQLDGMHNPNQNQNKQQQFGYPPIVGQYGVYNPYQNQNQHQQFGYPPVVGEYGVYQNQNEHHQYGHPPVVGQDGGYIPNPNQNQHQQFGYPPVVGQDGIYNPNQQGEWSLDQTMNNPGQMGLSKRDDNNQLP